MKKLLLLALPAIFLLGCNNADIASSNISKAADNFEIERRIVFYNGITNDYMLSIEGRCALQISSDKVTVTCRTGADSYKKHYLGLSDNVTFFAEQVGYSKVSAYRYKVMFKPESLIPDIDLNTSSNNAKVSG